MGLMGSYKLQREHLFRVITGLSLMMAMLLFWFAYTRCPISLSDLPVLLLCTGFAILAELFNIELPRIGTVSIGFAIEFAVLVLFGALVASLITIVSTLATGLRRKWDKLELWRVIYNISINSSAVCISWFVYDGLGGSSTTIISFGNIVPLFSASLMYFLFNSVIVLGTACLIYETRFGSTWYSNAKWALPNHITLTTLGVLLAEIYRVVGLPGVILLTIPLLFARYSLNQYLKVKKAHMGIIRAFARALEAKDSYTKGHSDRVTHYAELMANYLKLSAEYVDRVVQAAQMHDVGKIGVPEIILNKPSKLDPQEFELVKAHPITGADILQNVDFLTDIAEIIKYHHEWYDGSSGYPGLLQRDEIPLGSRILMVADSYDAMTSDRPYRPAMTPLDAISELERGKGRQFDPDIVEAFIKILQEEESLDAEPNYTNGNICWVDSQRKDNEPSVN